MSKLLNQYVNEANDAQIALQRQQAALTGK
jgi:hypothetical protein